MTQKNGLDGIKVAFLNLGCKVNSYETEAMIRLFREEGAVITDFEAEADVYIVNTCTVTGVADKKSRQMLHRAKKKNPKAIVAAVGCYAQEAGEKLLQDASVDIVVGNNRKSMITELVKQALSGSIRNEICDLSKEAEYESLFISDVSEKTRAYIKIQDGCNQFCSYCIIPYVRGRIRSRKSEDILQEVQKLTEKGYQEIVLTGIHLSSYGKKENDGKIDGSELAKLILELDAIPGLKRIRLGSLEPRIITESFTEQLKKAEKLCPHFHLSLQSGCDETLKRMNRKYTSEEYAKACELLRSAFDRPAITTDVIVGFPGEDEEEFEKTCQFLQKIRFAQMHIFRYSVRKGTVAEKMSRQVPESIKAERSEKLLALDRQFREEYLCSIIGEDEEILTEDTEIIDGKEYRTGHSRRYVKFVTDAGNAGENEMYTGICERFSKEDILYLR